MGTSNDIIKREFDSAKFTKIFNERYLKKKESGNYKLTRSAYKDELAHFTGKEPSTVRDWFRRHSPIPETLDKIAEFLGITTDAITTPVSLFKNGKKNMANKKMLEFGITEIKTYKLMEYTLWNGLKVYLKHRLDTPKNELYTLYLEDFCLCDISPENAEDEDRLIDIMNDVIDDDCILDYAEIAHAVNSSTFFPEPELLLRKNIDKLEQRCKEDDEYCRSHNIDLEKIITPDKMKNEFLKDIKVK